MKLSPKAMKQMYPQLAGTNCESHGEQPRSKVPAHLKKVFESRPNPDWVCSECLSEAKEHWDQHQKDLKRLKKEEKEARRQAIADSKEAAKNADISLDAYVYKCQAAVKAVDEALHQFSVTTEKIIETNKKIEAAAERRRKANDDVERYTAEGLALGDVRIKQFETLEKADKVVEQCYNDLRHQASLADQLWKALGKSAKKKRNKKHRKAALAALKDQDGKRTDTVERNSNS